MNRPTLAARPVRSGLVAVLAAGALALSSCAGSASSDEDGPSGSAASSGSEATSGTAAPEASSGTAEASDSPAADAEPETIHIVSGGDILLHLSVNAAAQRAAGGKLDYTALMKTVEPYVKGADLAICALEVPVAPPGTAPSNYPAFGSPKEIAASMKAMGWDGCATATNHSMDRGFDGVKATLDALDEAGLGHHGTARTAEEAEQTQYYTLKVGDRDLKVAQLSATTLTNGIPLPAGQPWSWNVVGKLGNRSVDDVIGDAKRARAQGADLVVTNMHWGEEYVSEPVEEQTRIADALAKSGQIDVVFGNHSHVPEPVTELDGGPDGQGMWVVWSQGNMISGQSSVAQRDPRVTSGLLTTATVEVPAEGNAHVTKMDWTALTQDMNTDHVYPLRKLEKGYKDAGMGISPAEIKRRGDATYPVMKGAAERTAPPKPNSTFEGQKRE
jgi:poly-gamma-glutamate capsule biosynthesis protein CapA/YwtB (metallophosphatase superfamily)